MGDLFGSAPSEPPFTIPDRDGYSCVWDERWRGFRVTIPHGAFFYSEQFFNTRWSDRAVEYFHDSPKLMSIVSARKTLNIEYSPWLQVL